MESAAEVVFFHDLPLLDASRNKEADSIHTENLLTSYIAIYILMYNATTTIKFHTMAGGYLSDRELISLKKCLSLFHHLESTAV